MSCSVKRRKLLCDSNSSDGGGGGGGNSSSSSSSSSSGGGGGGDSSSGCSRIYNKNNVIVLKTHFLLRFMKTAQLHHLTESNGNRNMHNELGGVNPNKPFHCRY